LRLRAANRPRTRSGPAGTAFCEPAFFIAPPAQRRALRQLQCGANGAHLLYKRFSWPPDRWGRPDYLPCRRRILDRRRLHLLHRCCCPAGQRAAQPAEAMSTSAYPRSACVLGRWGEARAPGRSAACRRRARAFLFWPSPMPLARTEMNC
jgi:hypothetical protein